MLFLAGIAAEAAVGMSLGNQLLGIFLVNIQPLALNVWAAVTADVRSLVRYDMGGCKGAVNKIHGISYETLLVGVFDAQQKISFICLGKKISVQCGTQVADVHVACRARCESGTDTVTHVKSSPL